MPAKKSTGASKTAAKKPAARSASGKNGTKSGAAKVSVSPAKKQAVKREPERRESERAIHQVLPYLFAFFALFMLLCLLFPDTTGSLGAWIRAGLTGVFGGASFVFAVLLLIAAFFWRKDVDNHARGYKLAFAVVVMLSFSVFFRLLYTSEECYRVAELYDLGQRMGREINGGVVGGILGSGLYHLTGPVGAWIITVFCMLLFSVFYIGMTPRYIFISAKYHAIRRREQLREQRAEGREESWSEQEKRRLTEREERIREMRAKAAERDEELQSQMQEPLHVSTERRGRIDANIYTDDARTEPLTSENPLDRADAPAVEEGSAIDASVFDDSFEVGGVANGTAHGDDVEVLDISIPVGAGSEAPETAPQAQPAAVTDLNEIFADPEKIVLLRGEHGEGTVPVKAESVLEVHREPVGEEPKPAPSPEKPKPAYHFPPLTLLAKDTSAKNVDVSAELKENAEKLVETLQSFHVNTKIIDISRGPTITRYELAPEAGTRVRAISNLVDDIALNLATTGVRIESPIPGKSAVGVEVPNKAVATVYIRELIENKTFREAGSRLTCALGMDVAGTPVYCDLAKMPHMLISGATGQGKSVCMNSLIVSLLYKASPEQVKLIMIDPKKVELNIYNGIPHLLVPVVSDPKKAAGALHWAVTEMERRFELIESVGVRDLGAYNTITKDDPEKEYLPQIVILIDELADLMMTAPDDVEESICRIAQKARAAGMHLVIGTQRPSVDVITGLIKSNIPSRIAFRTSSQIDSRTIIDIAGAEKLIGRGDMLYAPVGISKPMRVQGAFVSEKEIEGITDFLKNSVGLADYSDEVMETIEKEAKLCGQKKGHADAAAEDGGDDDADPMLTRAIELAVDSGKISTSLIQRRLSLGYGRAAKIIDMMERKGIVSEPEGQKPRSVLITKEQWMEMKVRAEDGEI